MSAEPATHRDSAPEHKGSKLVLQPDEGVSYWQPRPANGYTTIKVSPDNCASNAVTMGSPGRRAERLLRARALAFAQ